MNKGDFNMATIVITTKLDAKLANEMKHYCVDNNLKIMAFITQAIQEKLGKKKNLSQNGHYGN